MQLGLGLELGEQQEVAAAAAAAPDGDRLLDFSEELNSMYVALLEDF